MEERPEETEAERLYDEYLDAALSGEGVDPVRFCRERGIDSEELVRRLAGVFGLLSGPGSSTAEDERTESSEGDELPFERLGDYRILKRIGQGGMGLVFLAEHEPLGRRVALKVLRPELTASPTAARRLVREARAIAKLEHPGIVEIYDFGVEEGVRFFTMEYVPGKSLSEVFAAWRREGRKDVQALVSWGAEVADVLTTVHASGVLHRDVKPSNVRIDEAGRARLVDFGLALDADEEGATLTHSFIGSPAYASPEQLSGDRAAVDGRSDQYSLAATLYEGLTGRTPYVADSIPGLTRAMDAADPPPLRAVDGTLPRDLDVVIGKALERERERRYPSTREFALDLRAILELRSIRARPPGWRARLSSWGRRHRGLAVVLGVSLTILLATGALMVGRGIVEGRRDRQAARVLVTDAGELLDSLEELREESGEAEARARQLRDRAQLASLTAIEERDLWAADRVVTDFERFRARAFVDVLDLLAEAALLDPRAPGLAETRAQYFYQRYLGVRSHQDLVVDTEWRDRILSLDPDGEWAKRTAGHVKLVLEIEPPTAEVYLFRYFEERDVGGGESRRWVPAPVSGVEPSLEPGVEPGTPAFVVLRERGELRPGDLILSVEDRPVDLVDLEHVATGGLRAEVWTDAQRAELVLPSGLELRRTHAPLCIEPARSYVPDPDGREIDPGCYLALVRAPGFEDQRVSFHVDHAVQAWSKDLRIEVALQPLGTSPGGFVFVSSGPRNYWMQEREVTCDEYLRFLNSVPDPPEAWIPRHPRSLRDAVSWPRTEDGFRFPDGARSDHPVLGVSYIAAQAYVAWMNESQALPAGMRYALPTSEQWHWAGFGGDWRDFVFGDTFLPRWTSSRFARDRSGPTPVMSHPVDESSLGIFDMAGSAREWLRTPEAEGLPGERIAAGGSWADSEALTFRVSHKSTFGEHERSPLVGFRLVMEPKP